MVSGIRKALIFICFALGLFTGCKKDKLDASLTGDWRLELEQDGGWAG